MLVRPSLCVGGAQGIEYSGQYRMPTSKGANVDTPQRLPEGMGCCKRLAHLRAFLTACHALLEVFAAEDLLDGNFGAVGAGHPAREQQGQRTGFDRQALAHIEDATVQIGSVHSVKV